MSEKYEKQVYLAMLAEQCTRYEDMMTFLEDMVKTKTEDLTSDFRREGIQIGRHRLVNAWYCSKDNCR